MEVALMHRRYFLLLSIATLIAAMAGKSRKSAGAHRKDEPSDYLTREHRLLLRRIENLRRELAARNRQLELAHRSLTAQLDLARAMVAQGVRS
jgi:hypothetical protein